MPYCVICGKGQARLNSCNLCKRCKANTPETIDDLTDIEHIIQRNETIPDPIVHSVNYVSDSTDDLIKVGVQFDTSPSADIIFNSKSSHDVTLDINDNIPIILETYETSETFNKYNVVVDGLKDLQDFLKSLINKQYETIDFLKKELDEKNLQIQHLISKEAYVNSFVREISPADPVFNSTSNKDVEKSTLVCESSIDNNNDDNNSGNDDISYYADDEENIKESSISMQPSTIITNVSYKTIDDQITTYRQINHASYLRKLQLKNIPDDNMVTADESKPKFIERGLRTDSFRYEWEKHSSGFAGRIIEKMGYKGKGLGKNEDGIIDAIKLDKYKFDMHDNKTERKKKLYILSSSMLNQMDEKRLSRNNIDVKVRCHGGCTVNCMYTHLPPVFAAKPDFIILHIGSNDCFTKNTGKTSDVILEEIKILVEYITKNLPYAKLIISLPIVRSDCSTSHHVQQILMIKLKRFFYPCLDHSNVDLSHLGKKGLHLNRSGTRLVARNIISLIKQL